MNYQNTGFTRLSNWSDDFRYMVIPNQLPEIPQYSFKIIDTMDDSVIEEVSIPSADGYPMGFRFMKKVPGQNYVWATPIWGHVTDNGFEDTLNIVRIDTQTYDYQMFAVCPRDRPFTDFSISPDGTTLSFSKRLSEELIVWSPE